MLPKGAQPLIPGGGTSRGRELVEIFALIRWD